MPSIRSLPPSVVNQIAAGEVIERPASAVKELIENAIDAHASSITVELAEGGRDLIRVVDDGVGIAGDELPLAIAVHATSKLTVADDLFRVRTLGFRGEALSSIAGVSEFRLRSRPPDQPLGAEIEVRHGHPEPVRECGCPPGTQIEVRHLFANTPVRRKFLKTRQTELGHVSEVMTRFALSHPRLALRLVHNGRVVIDRSANLERRDAIGALFGSEVGEALLPIDSRVDDVRISGFVVDPRVDRPNARGQYLFLNGRFFRDRSLGHALSEAYRGLLMTGRYAVSFVFIELPADQVDVNVHPAKIEARFLDPHRIYSQLLSTVRTRFLASDLTPRPKGGFGPDQPSGMTKRSASVDAADESGAARAGINQQFALAAGPTSGAQRSLWEQGSRSAPAPLGTGAEPAGTVQAISAAPMAGEGRTAAQSTSGLAEIGEPRVDADIAAFDEVRPELVGTTTPESEHSSPSADGRTRALQLHNSYLVVETEEGMLLIDQHALHERILYEQLRRRVADGAVETQELLVPEPVELPPVQVGMLLEHRAVLLRLGLRIEEFGDRCVLAQSVPMPLRHKQVGALVCDIAGRLEETGRTPSRDQLLAELLHLMACKGAIKAGDPLSDGEIEELVRRRDLVEDSHHCPHGRPTALRFTLRDLEREFKRN